MVVRYKDICEVSTLLRFDCNSKSLINFNLKKLNKKHTLLKNFDSKRNLHAFRYFFWLFYSMHSYTNFNYFIKYFKYVINLINLLLYLKCVSIKYYILFHLDKVSYSTYNKLILKKFIRYLFSRKKIRVLFFFKKNSFNFTLSLLKLKYNILNIQVSDPKFIYFFLYLNYC